MKSLFRSIRRKLLDEGKLLRYLTYALGEIVLIVVGILFALKINDWNEDQKAEAEFETYLVQLKEDVTAAIGILEEEAGSSESKVERELFLLGKIKGEPIAPDELRDFEYALNGLGRAPELHLDLGYLAGLLDGDLTPIVKERALTLETLGMAQSLNNLLRDLNDKVRIIQMADETFMNYRGRGAYRSRGANMSYDLDELRSSNEFLYALENALEARQALGNIADGAKARLDGYLRFLEEYE